MDSIKARKIITGKIRDLPTLPDMIHKSLALVGDEATSAKKLGSLISYDQAISSRFLKVANSAYYGFMKKVATVQHAIVILGFKEVKSLVLGIAVFDTLKGSGIETSLSQEDFWMHAMGSAMAGQIICKKLGKGEQDTTFTASLLHDIGKLVLDVFFTQMYGKVVEKVRVNGAGMVETEQELMGFSHADVGGWLCEKWKLPPVLTCPIRFHHQVENVDKNYLGITSIVHLADILSKRAHIGNSGDSKIPDLQLLPRDYLKLQEDDLTKLTEQLALEKDKAESFLNSIQ